jgi:hypothetical protein
MTERALQELALLRAWWPGLEFAEAGLWVRLADYRVPCEAWAPREIEVALQIPAQLPGQAPYGFYVRPGLELVGGGTINHYTYPSHEPPFEGGPWGKFSWAPADWRPAAKAEEGSNMVEFACSLAARLREGA